MPLNVKMLSGTCPNPPLGSNTTYNMGVSLQSKTVRTKSVANLAGKTITQNKNMYHPQLNTNKCNKLYNQFC